MSSVIEESKCTGCTACKNVCPKKCISMEYNTEGFLYPNINDEECIKCGLCKRTCPVLNNKPKEGLPETFAAKNKKDEERLTSSSGGIFEVLAKNIINHGGIVCGAYFNKNEVKHGFAKNMSELEKLKGSKYVQSNLNDVFTQVKEELDKNKKVLFVGTACQVAGLYAYIKKDYSNLYTCDVICHGVPSPKVFKDYCESLEKKYNSKITNYEFRNKETGWKNYSTKVSFKNGIIYQTLSSEDQYMRGYLQNLYIRECCSACSFKQNKHVSDLTLGDFWGVDKFNKKLNDDKGVSLVLVNSDKGKNILDEIKDDIQLSSCTFEEATASNKMLYKSTTHSVNRDNFFNELSKSSLDVALNKYVNQTPLWKKCIKKIIYRKK